MLQEHLIYIQMFGKRFNKFLNQYVDVFRCRKCGFKTEGHNLIEFHVIFQCK
jgi:rubrerythrin